MFQVNPQRSLFKKSPRNSNLMRQWDGKLTRQLNLHPGGHGLGMLPQQNIPETTTTTVCGFCSTGCGLNIHLKNNQAVGLTPSTNYPVNQGMACPKGWESLAVLDSPDRATTPLLRNTHGKLKPVDWDTALTTFTNRFKDIQAKHGAESVAFLSTGQIPTEEMALLGAFAKFGMGVIHGDGNTRQCMATAVTAYKQSFGFDAPPYTYQDFEESDVIVLVGSNLCIAHPIMWERINNNPHNPNIIVIDPRKTETAMAATTHLPLQPKSDLMLFYGLAHILIRENWIDSNFIKDHTNDFQAFKEHTLAFTPNRVAYETGLSEQTILQTAQAIAQGKRVSFWWTMGVNQSHQGTRTAQAIINLALMTGNIGRPGTGANSITGQCNAMGSRLFSNTTGLFGGRDFTNAQHRATVANTLGMDADRIPDQPSLAYDKILDAIVDQKIKGLWIVATNSAHSWINQKYVREVLDRLDFLVVQDMYHNTETAQNADLLLPAAGWGEKEGTFINSERRIGVLKKVRKAPGEALSDFAIVKLLTHYWGCEQMFDSWESPEAVFKILKKLSVGQPCDFSGIEDYKSIDQRGGIQWPYPTNNANTTNHHRRLFEDGRFYHPDSKAKFIFDQPVPLPEKTDNRFPLTLITGRGTTSQWHTQTRTRQSTLLRKLSPQNIYIEINPTDAKQYDIKDNKPVSVHSHRGRITANAFISQSVQPGQVFIPMHYKATNILTRADFDPHSRQPSYKACAVCITPATYWAPEDSHE